MKKIISFLSNFKKFFLKKEDFSITQLEEIKNNFTKKIDQKIESIYNKINYSSQLNEMKDFLGNFRESIKDQMKRIPLKNIILYLVGAPFIYSMIIPAIMLHIFLEIYHIICFPLYGIPKVKSSDYFVFDRKTLPYLNVFEKINCLYCSYFNCLIAYTREIAGRTELFWCPIKHSKNLTDPHKYYKNFTEYTDGEKYRKRKITDNIAKEQE